MSNECSLMNVQLNNDSSNFEDKNCYSIRVRPAYRQAGATEVTL